MVQERIARGEGVLAAALDSIRNARTQDGLAQAKAAALSKKGALTLLFREMGALSEEQRKEFGQRLNQWKVEIEGAVDRQRRALRCSEMDDSAGPIEDISMPGVFPDLGSLHPVTRSWQRLEDVFTSMGYTVESGPEIETDTNNFQKLNIPEDHPARDMHDTFYLTDDVVLRTHTSPVQVRVMERRKPPIFMIAPGPVFRRDSDVTHTPMFHQLEGLAVAKGLTFAHLKGTLDAFAKAMFGPKVKLRFRPSYFPFTEPSAEVDLTCTVCKGKGCRVCKDTGWLEILGCGMVHPAVLRSIENEGYDVDGLQGFAFGMGIDRIAMLLHGIDDLRLMFQGDLDFLRQFPGV